VKRLAFLVAGIFVLIGLAGIVVPDRLVTVGRQAITPLGLLVVGALRVAMGVVLILAAPTSRVPRTLRVVGVVIVAAGLATPVFGVDRAQRVADWGIAHGSVFLRGAGLAMVAIGGLIGFAVAGRRRPGPV
jgi:hypothetical protein